MTEADFEKFTISQGVILIKDNKCLIGEFVSSPGLWGLPGGRIDKKEDSNNALKRELMEEIHLSKFDIIELLDFNVWYNRKGIPRSSVIYLINADVVGIKAGDEFLQIQWVSEQDLGEYNFFSPNTIKAIKKGYRYLNEKSSKT